MDAFMRDPAKSIRGPKGNGLMVLAIINTAGWVVGRQGLRVGEGMSFWAWRLGAYGWCELFVARCQECTR